MHITHWTSEALTRQAVADAILPAISARSIRRILQEVDLKPHRTRYGKTSVLNAEFNRRAEKILWCYANAQRLAHLKRWIVCLDEMPNLQVLERRPLRRAKPGLIERMEFEYTRHGTVTVPVFLIVHTGRMETVCIDTSEASF